MIILQAMLWILLLFCISFSLTMMLWQILVKWLTFWVMLEIKQVHTWTNGSILVASSQSNWKCFFNLIQLRPVGTVTPGKWIRHITDSSCLLERNWKFLRTFILCYIFKSCRNEVICEKSQSVISYMCIIRESSSASNGGWYSYTHL